MDKSAIRDAATVILLRDRATAPKILMGQRGAKAAFMPNKFVFPGGAVDIEDQSITLAGEIGARHRTQLAIETAPSLITALQVAAVREVWEETGLILGRPGSWPGTPPTDWVGFAATGHLPFTTDFSFVFRAITPPGRPRRFDARFFMVDAAAIMGDPDDFSQASDELSQLQWVPIEDVRKFDLPFITEVVLAEVSAIARGNSSDQSVPFFRNDDEESLMLRLGNNDDLNGQNQQ